MSVKRKPKDTFDIRRVKAGEEVPFPCFYRDSVNRTDGQAKMRCQETLAAVHGESKRWFSLNFRSFEYPRLVDSDGWIVFCVEPPTVNALGLESL